MATNAGVPLTLFAPPRVIAEESGDGASGSGIVLRSAEPLGDHPVTVLHSLREHARAAPDHLLVAERHPDATPGWRGCSYGEAVAAVDSIGQALLDTG
jgi:feruloyl-CoA synthase